MISLGLIGAGTNNARIAGMLRNLSSYYYKDASLLFCVMHLKNSAFEFSLYPCGFFSVHLFPSVIFSGANRPRSCPLGEGLIDTESLSF